jgi:hypothetical protein
MALAAITDHGDFFTLDDVKVSILIVIDLHNFLLTGFVEFK